MKIKEGIIAVRVFNKELGRKWPGVLARSLRRKNELLRNANISKMEKSEFVKRLPFVSAVYLELSKTTGPEKALTIMRRIIVPVGLNESMQGFLTLKDHFVNPMEHLISYLDYIDENGAGRFCEREYPTKNDLLCHRLVTKCPFYDLFREFGTPELTQLFCEVDKVFYEKAFPKLLFHRGDSWENTIAFGKDHCDFLFELKK